MVSAPHSLTMGWLNLKICRNLLVTNFFLTFVAGETSMGGVKNIWGSNIYYYINALLLFHFFRISQHPENWSVPFKNFVRKCQCISCYLPISSNLQFQLKKVIFRNSLLVYLSRILTTNSRTPCFWRTIPLAVSPPFSILVKNTKSILADIDCTVLIRRIYISSSRTIISILQN